MDELRVGDRVRNIYTGSIGNVVRVWDGKYICPYYEGEQYNPYRIMVEEDHQPDEPIENFIHNYKAEHLERI